jgi:hypothetical protein
MLEYWEDLGNRRKYLENFARQNSFDPFVEANWANSATKKLFIGTKVQISNLFI